MQVMVALDVEAVPLLEGAAECASGGYLSSLHPENVRAAAVVEGGLDGLQAGLLALLVDPQTGQLRACSGGVQAAWCRLKRRAVLLPCRCAVG